ncbi:hypothetical protein SPOG_02282 [Schizosaccharomyces cryophilus OY26]|uniref:Uncharacterized protein n=1 Tax=Schizosaccharomyces cryophilus (strain OY26 / ATCC MYA-4695 / CBS 11777 / NBRC 106824 / NRRL Y48691) TaxID=653667 RepID=S9VT97_SCHCR|nr:uncharacterized protein SPOG_02282 [Schizosaccharomyces cryophilus OY26]EPY51103.1 hypothetical protein SPOG_02282 [Schizosaccharomyces cryophilus OY26]
MNEKEKEMQPEVAKPTESPFWVSPTSSDSCLPSYSEIDYSSHVDDLEKGYLCLRPIRGPPCSEKKSQEASMNASENSNMEVLLLIICPAKVARIPQATVKVVNETARLVWCYIFAFVLDFVFSDFLLFPFIKKSMENAWIQWSLAGLLAILAFWICVFVVSYLLDLFILSLNVPILLLNGFTELIGIINPLIASIFGFDTTLERNNLAGDNPIPLNTIPSESQNLSSDPNTLTDEQPSSECVEQFPERQRKPSQSRDVENTGNLESS